MAWNVAAVFLTLSVPLVIFLRHNGYGIVRPETLVIHGLNLVAFLVLELPLTVFLRHQAYGLLWPETLAIHGLTLLGAAVCGLVMTFGGTPGRIVAATALAVLVVDVQTDWITAVGLRLLLNVLGWGLVFWVVRRRVRSFLVALAVPMLIIAFLTPSPATVHEAGTP